ncbi:FHA domain-containing protein [Amycolatopsis sp. NPDC003861]
MVNVLSVLIGFVAGIATTICTLTLFRHTTAAGRPVRSREHRGRKTRTRRRELALAEAEAVPEPLPGERPLALPAAESLRQLERERADRIDDGEPPGTEVLAAAPPGTELVVRDSAAPLRPADPATEVLVAADLQPSRKAVAEQPASPVAEGGEQRRRVATTLAWLRGTDDFLLSRASTVIGRSSQCDIVLGGDRVSRRHCVISQIEDDWWLEAFPTSNGTSLNGQAVSPGRPVRLRNGDEVCLGGAEVLSLVVPRDRAGELCFDAFGDSVIGSRRKNEDAFFADFSVVAVADGVGGRPAGAVAARMAVDGVRHAGPEQDLAMTAANLNRAIRARGADDVLATGLATTLDVAMLRPHGTRFRVEGLHVGDGTVLLQTEAGISRLVQPHATQGFALAGRRDPVAKGRLLRAVGLTDSVQPDHWEKIAAVGQRFVLATDGLVGSLGAERLEEVLLAARDEPPRECVATLLAMVGQVGAADNVTVVVADVIEERKQG